MSSEVGVAGLDVGAESRVIMVREGGWRDAPPDPPTMRGISLPLWNEWCLATNRTWCTGKRALRASTEADALSFYSWYFREKGLAGLITEFSVPQELIPLVMDLRTQHSEEGCRRILRFAADVQDTQSAVIALSRIRYVLEMANGPQPHLKKDMRGLVQRALSAIGWWPIRSSDRIINT